MAVRARDAGARVPQNDAEGRNAPRYVEPHDGVGSTQQVIDPPQINAFADPGGPSGNGSHIGEALCERTFRTRAADVGHLIEIEDGAIQARGQLPGEVCFAAPGPTCHVDTPHR